MESNLLVEKSKTFLKGHSGYRLLAFSLFFVLISIPILYQLDEGSQIVTILSIFPYLAGLYVIKLQKGDYWSLAFNLGLASIVLELTTYFFTNPHLIAVSFAIFALYLLAISIAILKDIFARQHFSADTLYGAVCVYLLLGLVWALIYSILYWSDPSSFSHNTNFTPIASLQDTPEAYFPRFLYFSLVTLTTLGYGDVAPGNLTGSMLSSLEAVVGQLYVAILIARLVSLTPVQQSAQPETSDQIDGATGRVDAK